MTPTRRDFIQRTGAGLLGVGALPTGCGSASGPPNILYVMSDQQHWQAAGYRDPFFDTPVQDALAKESFVFDNFFCSTPQCSPSRSSMFTGLYPTANGVMGNVGAAGGEPLRMKTFGAHLQDAGYATGYFGKWHLGDEPVANAGWDEEARRQEDPETTTKTLDFIRRHTAGEKPFALVASYVDPHDVYYFKRDMGDISGVSATLPESWAREEFTDKPPVQKQFMTEDQGTVIWNEPEKEIWQHYHEFYRGKVKLFDDALGKIVAALKEAGAWENTVIVVSSDHGDMDTNHRLIYKGPFMYEHMVRIPLMIRVPEAHGGLAPRQVGDVQSVNVDLAPTILDFARLPVPECDSTLR